MTPQRAKYWQELQNWIKILDLEQSRKKTKLLNEEILSYCSDFDKHSDRIWQLYDENRLDQVDFDPYHIVEHLQKYKRRGF